MRLTQVLVDFPCEQICDPQLASIMKRMDRSSRWILIGWITTDVIWALLFVRALKRAKAASGN
jgi:hypothetical protein